MHNDNIMHNDWTFSYHFFSMNYIFSTTIRFRDDFSYFNFKYTMIYSNYSIYNILRNKLFNVMTIIRELPEVIQL